MQPGGRITLADGQTLRIASGSILMRSGAAGSISGGTLDVGSYRGAIHTAGDLAISSSVIGSGSLVKVGAGTLRILGRMDQAGGLEIASGEVRLHAASSVGALVTVHSGTTLRLDGTAV
jgi:hypothetical protein